jgi:hypothetical protein
VRYTTPTFVSKENITLMYSPWVRRARRRQRTPHRAAETWGPALEAWPVRLGRNNDLKGLGFASWHQERKDRESHQDPGCLEEQASPAEAAWLGAHPPDPQRRPGEHADLAGLILAFRLQVRKVGQLPAAGTSAIRSAPPSHIAKHRYSALFPAALLSSPRDM